MLYSELTFLPGAVAKVYYMINMRNAPISESNKLSLIGFGVNSLIAGISTEKRMDAPTKLYNIDSILTVRFKEYEVYKVKFDKNFNSIDTALSTQKILLQMGDYYISMSKLNEVRFQKEKKEVFKTQMDLFFDKINEENIPKKLSLITEDPYLFIIFYTFIEYYGEEAVLKM